MMIADTRAIGKLIITLQYDRDAIITNFIQQARNSRGGKASKRDGIISATASGCNIDIERLWSEWAPEKPGKRVVGGGLFVFHAMRIKGAA